MGKKLGCKKNIHNKKERRSRKIKAEKDAPKVLEKYQQRYKQLMLDVKQQNKAIRSKKRAQKKEQNSEQKSGSANDQTTEQMIIDQEQSEKSSQTEVRKPQYDIFGYEIRIRRNKRQSKAQRRKHI
ncbi:MAG: hypothetical protein EZS28_048293 [Streblomastix strix]|uniref:Uncharacterized protein n=1 Tax=Streblomastix strix TaxID=222440 RepID=A0A5J4TEU9_9EUKA|nr:MAG: hypothetical protein EZS28_048293 [Streblomastix strix]